MSRAKSGDVLSCEVCGLAVIVDEECGCATIDLICCEEPMQNMGPAKPKKVHALSSPKKKKAVKKAKAAPKKKKAAKKKYSKTAEIWVVIVAPMIAPVIVNISRNMAILTLAMRALT